VQLTESAGQLTESAGWWMLTMNSHGVEMSIAGCVREMVRDPNLLSFFFFFFFITGSLFLGTRSFVQR